MIPSQPPFDVEPPWLVFARQYKGIRETTVGGKLNPMIADMFSSTRFPKSRLTPTTPWCAAMVSHCLARVGMPSPRTANAAACALFGVASEPRSGAIVVMAPGVVGAGISGHVGFWEKAAGDQFWLFSGNCRNTARSLLYPVSRIVAVRWPGDATASPTDAGAA